MAKDEEEVEAEAKGGGKKKIVIIALPIVLLLAGAVWFFFLKKDDSGAPKTLPHPTPGAVVKLDPITVNLAGAHFLKFGMALQPTASAHEVDGSKALDLAITQFSQLTIEDLSTPEGKSKAKEELVARIKLTYLPHDTDIAAATATEAASDKKETKKETKKESKKDESEAEEEHEEIHIAELSGEEVIKLADALTVQAEIYDVYFTEFVMQ
jgi:flagellar protein FliL